MTKRSNLLKIYEKKIKRLALETSLRQMQLASRAEEKQATFHAVTISVTRLHGFSNTALF